MIVQCHPTRKHKAKGLCSSCYLGHLRRVSTKTRNTNKQYRKQVAEERIVLVRKLKDTPCVDCGIKHPHYVMEFDHRFGAVKFKNVSKLVLWGTREQLLEEIKKCDVVCANCHSIRTYNRRIQIVNLQ